METSKQYMQRIKDHKEQIYWDQFADQTASRVLAAIVANPMLVSTGEKDQRSTVHADIAAKIACNYADRLVTMLQGREEAQSVSELWNTVKSNKKFGGIKIKEANLTAK